MREVAFRLWQIERGEYDVICGYLGITPNPELFRRLSEYLAECPFRNARPTGFSRFLAMTKLTRVRIGYLDLFTKWFIPGHPVRHALNGVIALHECDGLGYRELADSPVAWRAPLLTAGWLLRFALQVAAAAPWLAWHSLVFVAGIPWRKDLDLAGMRILITGVGRGLGKDLMLHCLELGAKVVGTVRHADEAPKLRRELPASAPIALLAADLSVPNAVVGALQDAGISAGSIDIAVLSAGTKIESQSLSSLHDLRETFQVNFFSAAELAGWLYAVGGEKRPARHAIVLVSSMGRWHGMPFTSGYNASKAALSIWGESLEMELRQTGDRHCAVTIVEPGIFRSGMSRETPLTRFLSVSRYDVANRILYGAMKGKRSIRVPRWFAFLTWGVCIAGRGFRNVLFARARPRSVER